MAKIVSFVLLAAGASLAFGYKAAFVEHAFVSACGEDSCGKLQRAASVKSYAVHAADAAGQGAQIIVFPEYGITGESSYPKSAWVDGGYTEVIPEPTGAIPCNALEAYSTNAPSIASLSCMAKQNKIAIVANLIDYQNEKVYNTNVAFDTDGSFIAKYHKQNLWGESNMDTPDTCAESTFKTSFGVTFGMFICADLIYQHPAVDLVKKGIKNFAMPLGWTNEMTSLQAMPYAQGWSALYRVNIILANLRQETGSGSGIWSAGRTLVSEYMPGGATSKVHVAEVPEEPTLEHASSVNEQVMDAQDHGHLNLTCGNSQWKFVELKAGKVCSGSVCCTVGVSAGGVDGYALAALDGLDSEEGVAGFPAQVCAIVPCETPGKDCLRHQSPEGFLQGVWIQMSGVSSTNVVPQVLATGASGAQELLLTQGSGQDGFTFSRNGSKASLHVSTTKRLASAILYGRAFSKDTLPYTCGGSCPKCSGYSCDEWIAWNSTAYPGMRASTCPELERDYGCDCSGCRCSTPARGELFM